MAQRPSKDDVSPEAVIERLLASLRPVLKPTDVYRTTYEDGELRCTAIDPSDFYI